MNNSQVYTTVNKNININYEKGNKLLKEIRGRLYTDVLLYLKSKPTKTAFYIWQTLNSSAQNLVNKFKVKKELLYISSIFFNKGSTMKKIKAGSKGKGFLIKKRLYHLTVGLDIK